jgi:hypothetical protein
MMTWRVADKSATFSAWIGVLKPLRHLVLRIALLSQVFMEDSLEPVVHEDHIDMASIDKQPN